MAKAAFFHRDRPVIFVDNHLLALYKPAGLLIQGDHTGEPSLLDLGKQWIKERYEKPGNVFLGLVHRLDRPVAGVALFCRTSKASGRIGEQFRNRTAVKIYWAVIHGRLKPSQGNLCHHLIRRPGLSTLVAPCPSKHTREARLSYAVLDRDKNRSLVEIQLETGRHHQIRCQMAHAGHPIVGDLRYGAPYPLPQKQIALLAKRLRIVHPILKVPLDLCSPVPIGWPWSYKPEESDSVLWNWSEIGAAPET